MRADQRVIFTKNTVNYCTSVIRGTSWLQTQKCLASSVYFMQFVNILLQEKLVLHYPSRARNHYDTISLIYVLGREKLTIKNPAVTENTSIKLKHHSNLTTIKSHYFFISYNPPLKYTNITLPARNTWVWHYVC